MPILNTVTLRAGILSAAVATAGLIGGAGVAYASNDEKVEAPEIKASLIEKGYDVREIEREDGLFEVEVTKDGKRYELYVDPENGKILRSKLDD